MTTMAATISQMQLLFFMFMEYFTRFRMHYFIWVFAIGIYVQGLTAVLTPNDRFNLKLTITFLAKPC